MEAIEANIFHKNLAGQTLYKFLNMIESGEAVSLKKTEKELVN